MKPLFVFGTLRHTPLFDAVLGAADHLTFTPAIVSGFSVLSVAEGPFPTIVRSKDHGAHGLVVNGLTAADRDRLDYYESAFGYTIAPVRTQNGVDAECYFPPAGGVTPKDAWSLLEWEQDWAALSILSAREVMRYFGTKSPQEVAQMFPMIRARAWSHLNAAHSRHGAHTMMGRVEVAHSERVYANYFALDEVTLRHEQFDGSMSPEVLRAVFLAPDATLVLPYDPVRDCVLLVEQMRMGPLARGDDILWQLEPIAGRLDPGEAPQDAARREAVEEAGLSMGTLLNVAECYCSPGNSSEFYYIYVGLADLPDATAGLGGLDAEDEDIRSHVMPFDALMTLCETQQIANAPLVMATYWLAAHRDNIRRTHT